MARQGALDSMCALYAIVNAVTKLRGTQVARADVYEDLTSILPDDMFKKLVQGGVNATEMPTLLDVVTQLPPLRPGGTIVQWYSRVPLDNEHEKRFDWVRDCFNRRRGWVVLISTSSKTSTPFEHWTVVVGATENTLKLRDGARKKLIRDHNNKKWVIDQVVFLLTVELAPIESEWRIQLTIKFFLISTRQLGWTLF